MSALHAEAQMDPGIAAFQAFLAAAGVRLYIVNLVQVSTDSHTFIIRSCPERGEPWRR
jgi:hypothetical protein